MIHHRAKLNEPAVGVEGAVEKEYLSRELVGMSTVINWPRLVIEASDEDVKTLTMQIVALEEEIEHARNNHES